MIDQALDEMLLDATDPESYEIALLKVGSQLAKAEQRIAPRPPEPEPAAMSTGETVEEVPTHEWPVERLRAYLRDKHGPKPTPKRSARIHDERRGEKDAALSQMMAELAGGTQ